MAKTHKSLLSALPNPQRGEDMAFTLCMTLHEVEKTPTLTLRYVPDKDIIKDEIFASWLKMIQQEKWPSLEHLAAETGNAFYDTLLPAYMNLTIATQSDSEVVSVSHFVRHQPDYHLPETLQHLFR